jgi:hypothetical protein
LESTHLSPDREVTKSSQSQRTQSNLIQLLDKEQLKYRHACLHESMLRKVNVFDEQISTAEKMRKDQLLAVTFIDLFALSLKEEMMILRVFDLIEDEYEYATSLQILKLNSIVEKVKRVAQTF